MNKLVGSIYEGHTKEDRGRADLTAKFNGSCIINACITDSSSSCSGNFCLGNEYSGCTWFFCNGKGKEE